MKENSRNGNLIGSKRERMKKQVTSILSVMFAIIGLFSMLCFTANAAMPTEAAAMRVGSSNINGWKPDDMVESDVNVNASTPQEATSKFEQIVIVLVRIGLPFIAIGSVCVIIYNAVKNIFVDEEKRRPMSSVIKDIVVGFFWILFAWVAVELIIFVISTGETYMAGLLLS